jgi:hypothetical protein
LIAQSPLVRLMFAGQAIFVRNIRQRFENIVEKGKVLAQPGRGKILRRRKFGEL